MMRTLLPYLLLILAACATTSRPEVYDGRKALLEGFTIDEVREAARVVIEEVAHPRSVVRVSDARAMTEGRVGVCGKHVACGEGPYRKIGTPWTTIKVEFRNLGKDTAVEVSIDYETRAHCAERWLNVMCAAENLSSTGVLERKIISGIRARLGGESLGNSFPGPRKS